MKKYMTIGVIALLVVVVALFFTWNSQNGDVRLELRTYNHGEPYSMNWSYISFQENNGFQFTYSLLSSYLAIGKYTIEGNEVYCKTDDGENEYVFVSDGKTLIFDRERSSKLPEYATLDEHAVFE